MLFGLDWKTPYRDSKGTIHKLKDLFSGGAEYELPVASASTLGGVKIGASMNVSASGAIDTPVKLGVEDGTYGYYKAGDENITPFGGGGGGGAHYQHNLSIRASTDTAARLYCQIFSSSSTPLTASDLFDFLWDNHFYGNANDGEYVATGNVTSDNYISRMKTPGTDTISFIGTDAHAFNKSVLSVSDIVIEI